MRFENEIGDVPDEGTSDPLRIWGSIFALVKSLIFIERAGEMRSLLRLIFTRQLREKVSRELLFETVIYYERSDGFQEMMKVSNVVYYA